jgi:hypothetical protein
VTFKEGDLVFKKSDSVKPVEEREIYIIKLIVYAYDSVAPILYGLQEVKKECLTYWGSEYVKEGEIEHIPEWLAVIESLKGKGGEGASYEISSYSFRITGRIM